LLKPGGDKAHEGGRQNVLMLTLTTDCMPR
jgi:hypothetical protein